MKAADKVKAFDRIVKELEIPEADQSALPDALKNFIKHHGVMPTLMTLALNLETGKVVQIAMSEVAMKPEVYQALSKVTSELANHFSNIALKIAQHEAEVKNE